MCIRVDTLGPRFTVQSTVRRLIFTIEVTTPVVFPRVTLTVFYTPLFCPMSLDAIHADQVFRDIGWYLRDSFVDRILQAWGVITCNFREVRNPTEWKLHRTDNFRTSGPKVFLRFSFFFFCRSIKQLVVSFVNKRYSQLVIKNFLYWRNHVIYWLWI